MSTLLNYLNNPSKKGLFYWLKYLIKGLNLSKTKEIDNSWKGIKLSHTYTPIGWNSENAFSYLEQEWKGKLMKAYKD